MSADSGQPTTVVIIMVTYTAYNKMLKLLKCTAKNELVNGCVKFTQW